MSKQHNTHENSVAVYHEIREKLNAIELRIVEFLEFQSYAKGFTDRQIQLALNYENRSDVQPRMSDLITKGIVKEVGSMKCETTGKTVRISAINRYPESTQQPLKFLC